MIHTPHLTRRRLLACAAAAIPLSSWAAWPERNLRWVVPYAAGGGADTAARVIGQRVAELLGQPVVIDNRPGAGTAVGAAFAAKAAADGHTLLVSSGSTFTVNPALRPNLPYDAVKSFDPIGIVGRIPLIVLANKNQPASNVKGFVAAIKAAPGQLTYASFGSGTTSHFTAEIVLQAVGGQMMHVPYKGSAPAMTDLIGGQVAYSVDTVTAALPQLKAGKIKAIAVTTAKRSSQLPDVPTFAESGYPEIDADTWIMMVAPKGTPDAVRAKLEKTLATIVAEPATQAALRAQGVEPIYGDAKASVAQIDKELPLMRAVARRANIQAD
jgi:tripartite-type tricarboxylate transporter receptor subunit TctC